MDPASTPRVGVPSAHPERRAGRAQKQRTGRCLEQLEDHLGETEDS